MTPCVETCPMSILHTAQHSHPVFIVSSANALLWLHFFLVFVLRVSSFWFACRPKCVTRASVQATDFLKASAIYCINCWPLHTQQLRL